MKHHASSPLPDMRPARTATQRLRHVRSTVAALPDLDLEIQSTGDGRKAVLLPPVLLDVFVEDLQHRAQEWQEQTERWGVKCRLFPLFKTRFDWR